MILISFNYFIKFPGPELGIFGVFWNENREFEIQEQGIPIVGCGRKFTVRPAFVDPPNTPHEHFTFRELQQLVFRPNLCPNE